MRSSRKTRAASVDVCGPTDELPAASAKAAASDRGTCAEAATEKKDSAPNAPKTRLSRRRLPEDGLHFAESLHRRRNLLEVADKLLHGKDAKLKQRVLEQVLELAYSKNSRTPEVSKEEQEELPIGLNVPDAKRD